MDSVSQALWGGLSSVASSRDTNVRQTFIWGAVGGTLPDLDAWIGALVGPVQERIWHRGPESLPWFSWERSARLFSGDIARMLQR